MDIWNSYVRIAGQKNKLNILNLILSPAVLTDEFLVFVSFHEFIMTQLNDQLLVGLLALLVVERGTGIEDWVE